MKAVRDSKKIFPLYFAVLYLLTVYYLISTNTLLTNNAMSEWLINYQGGFVRRGLTGEFFFYFSKFLNLDLKFSILIFQIFIYLLYFHLIYKLIVGIYLNKFFILIFFSPAFLFFPLAELEALGRKEILVNIILLCSVLFFQKNKNLKLSFVFFGLTIILLIHEIIVFHFLYFCIFLLLINSKNLQNYNLKIFFIFIFLSILVFSIYFNSYDINMKDKMCLSLVKNFNTVCGFQTHYVVNRLETYIGEVSWQNQHYVRNSFIFVAAFGPIFLLSFFSKFNLEKCNNIFKKIPVILLLVILIVPNFLIFFISVDTGRYFNLTYSNLFIFFFGLYYNQLITIDYKRLKFFEYKIFPKNKVLTFFIIFLMSFSWSPKAVYLDDLGSFPIYRAIEKTPNYYKSILDIKFVKQVGPLAQ